MGLPIPQCIHGNATLIHVNVIAFSFVAPSDAWKHCLDLGTELSSEFIHKTHQISRALKWFAPKTLKNYMRIQSLTRWSSTVGSSLNTHKRRQRKHKCSITACLCVDCSSLLLFSLRLIGREISTSICFSHRSLCLFSLSVIWAYADARKIKIN